MRVLLGVSLALLVACSGDDDSTPTDAGRDASSPRDAAAPDAPALVDAAPEDAPLGVDAPEAPDGGPVVGCAGRTALFCEDFEESGATSDRWTQDVGNGTLSVDGEHARGARALHVHTNDNGRAFLRIPFAPPGNSHFGRMYLWVNEFPSAPNWAHYTLVELTGTGSGARVRPVGGQFAPTNDGAFWGIGSDGDPTGDWTNWRTSAPSESGRWVCVEWEMDASDNFIRLTFDGVANDDLTVDTNDHGGNPVDFVFPTFDTIKVGWQLYQGGTTPAQFDLWIDDLVLATERVGC
ncbi:MAG: hypothetical protein H6720_31235, partial [Sandaracinus sp.]|nr:hypothetical protein [Sandaracinus sp.]